MLLNSLELTNFRSYEKRKFTFSSSVTIIVGGNATGKTNLLEAIFLLSTGKSFRADKDIEMLGFGKEVGRVSGRICKYANMQISKLENEEEILETVLTKGEVMGEKTPIKKYKINEVAKRTLDFIGNLKVVLFWPQDLGLVTDSPSLRRRYLDFVLMQTDREYRRSLISYETGMRQRNKVLEAIRDHGAHHHQLIFWDQLLIKTGEYITEKREEYINYVNKYQILNIPSTTLRTSKFSRLSGIPSMAGQFSNYQLQYDSSIISRQRLDLYANEEIAAGVTLVGPHRDDIKFKVKSEKLKVANEEERDLSHFGSRGEQRLGILWLKMGELSYIENSTGGKPVLLLDDILSELDHEHRRIIFGIIGNQQTIMTTTDEHFIEKENLREAVIVKL